MWPVIPPSFGEIYDGIMQNVPTLGPQFKPNSRLTVPPHRTA